MVGVDFDLALGINLSAIDIFQYIDWSLILLLLLLVVFMFVCALCAFLGSLLPISSAVAFLLWFVRNMIDFCWCCSFIRLLFFVDQVLVCVRWLFWYLSECVCVSAGFNHFQCLYFVLHRYHCCYCFSSYCCCIIFICIACYFLHIYIYVHLVRSNKLESEKESTLCIQSFSI